MVGDLTLIYIYAETVYVCQVSHQRSQSFFIHQVFVCSHLFLYFAFPAISQQSHIASADVPSDTQQSVVMTAAYFIEINKNSYKYEVGKMVNLRDGNC